MELGKTCHQDIDATAQAGQQKFDWIWPLIRTTEKWRFINDDFFFFDICYRTNAFSGPDDIRIKCCGCHAKAPYSALFSWFCVYHKPKAFALTRDFLKNQEITVGLNCCGTNV